MIPERLKKEYFNAITLEKIKGLEFQGSSVAVFVSSLNYPKLSVGPVSLTEFKENSFFYDMPEKWFGLSKEKILKIRAELVNAVKKFNVSSARNPSYELIALQEIALASSKADIDVKLKNKPAKEIIYSNYSAPMTNFALLQNFSFLTNPLIERKVDYIYSDSDLKAEQAIINLYDLKIPVSSIQKIFSVGAIGLQKNRRLVPSKWAITAVDDIIAKHLIEQIKDFPEINGFQLFESHYLHNHFFVILLPFSFAFEMLECWLSNEGSNSIESIAQDFEFLDGRKSYASQIAGAYYSARLAVTEYLHSIKRQASIIVIREISPEYNQPLGVWQIRENVRHAMKQQPKKFNNIEILFKFLSKKLFLSSHFYKKKSKVIDFLFNQKRISDFV